MSADTQHVEFPRREARGWWREVSLVVGQPASPVLVTTCSTRSGEGWSLPVGAMRAARLRLAVSTRRYAADVHYIPRLELAVDESVSSTFLARKTDFSGCFFGSFKEAPKPPGCVPGNGCKRQCWTAELALGTRVTTPCRELRLSDPTLPRSHACLRETQSVHLKQSQGVGRAAFLPVLLGCPVYVASVACAVHALTTTMYRREWHKCCRASTFGVHIRTCGQLPLSEGNPLCCSASPTCSPWRSGPSAISVPISRPSARNAGGSFFRFR